VDRAAILAVVLQAMERTNQMRTEAMRLAVSQEAPLFGPPSPLDSLGLVSLLIDVEEALDEAGHPVILSDDRALSQSRSPFRTVSSLVEYIDGLLRESSAGRGA